MKSIFKTAILASTLALGLSACDSKKEDANEAMANAVRESGEATAAGIDAQAASGDAMGAPAANVDAMQNKAEGVRDAADSKADKMEDAADKKDATPE